MTSESKKFYKRSNQVKKTMCMKNAKMWMLIACIVTLVIIVITVPLVVQGVAAARALEDKRNQDEGKNETMGN